MESLLLAVPQWEHAAQAKEYVREHIEFGETHLPGAAGLEEYAFDRWLAYLITNADEKTVSTRLVPASTFFAVREEDQRIVGTVDIRHRLNEVLERRGGHIGYGVRPSERRKGYATEILRQALAYAKMIGINRALITSDRENLGSTRTILKNGGVLEEEYLYSDGNVVQRYWVDTNSF